MIRRDASSSDSVVERGASRRCFLQVLGAVPAVAGVASRGGTLAALHRRFDDEPVPLARSKEGRQLSRVRYHRAESFFHTLERGQLKRMSDALYYAGIVAQLGLSAHLLDVGFPDDWCARHIGLRVAKALTYANATGFRYECADMARLAGILTPYWLWRQPRLEDDPIADDGGFTIDHIQPLLRALLERVHSVTGHPRPNGWHQRRDSRV